MCSYFVDPISEMSQVTAFLFLEIMYTVPAPHNEGSPHLGSVC